MASVSRDVQPELGIALLEQLCRIEAVLRLLASEKIEEIKQSKWTKTQRKIYETCAEPRTGSEIAEALKKPWGNFNKTLYRMADNGWLVCFRVNGRKTYAQGL